MKMCQICSGNNVWLDLGYMYVQDRHGSDYRDILKLGVSVYGLKNNRELLINF